MQNTHQTIVTLQSDTIDTSSPALFWAEEPDERFLGSMKGHGQIEPVQVALSAGRILLLAGYRRVRAAVLLDLEVRAIPMEVSTPLQRGLLYLLTNLGRPTDEAMQVRALRFFTTCCGDEDIQEQILPLLGIDSGSRQERLLRDWLSLPISWDDLLMRQSVPLSAANLLVRLSPEEQLDVEPFFHGLKWSRQSALQWLTWLFERSRMEGVLVGELIEKTGMRAVISQIAQGLSPRDGIERLARAARRVRFPHLAAMEERFETLASALNKGNNWQVEHHGNFESTEIELRIRCSSSGQIERAAQTLQTMQKRREWHELWTLVQRGIGPTEQGDEEFL
jgi:hypothetical protein